MTYVATRSFRSTPYGEFREGDPVNVPEDAIKAWKRSGLIREAKVDKAPLALRGGRPRASSRLDRASTNPTSILSNNGESEPETESSRSTGHGSLPRGATCSTPQTENGGNDTDLDFEANDGLPEDEPTRAA